MEGGSTEDALAKISNKLTHVSPTLSRSSIYRVHRHLRNVNNKAYGPEIIAIGPYHRKNDHRKNDHLKMMEDLKWHYLKLLIKEKEQNKKNFVEAVGKLEKEARKCYAEPIKLSSADFIQMMVLDGCFIIHLVRLFEKQCWRYKDDPIFQMEWMMNSLQRDLMLLENQIPFIVLRKLFELIEVPNNESRLIFLLLKFFHDLYPGKGHKLSVSRSPDEIKHLLDLIYINWLPLVDFVNIDEEKKETRENRREKKETRENRQEKKETRENRPKWQFIQSAAKLKEANVKFVKSTDPVSLFKVEFKNGIMFLPPLTVEDRTESFFRNLIAYEQYFRDKEVTYVRDYVKFLDCLIDSSRDVEILRRWGIIDSWLGDDEVVAKMVNKLTDSVIVPRKSFIYGKIFEDVNTHYNTEKNRWMAKLRHNYLHSPWDIISIIVAVVFLLLAITQTVFSILQVVLPQKKGKT